MNLLDLFVKVGVDDQASSQLESISSGAIAKATAMGNAMYDIAKGVAGTAIDGIKSIAQGALEGYSSYEQLVGGVDKLYQGASEKLQRYAQNAYKTSGMSANQYMEQATSFSAALINSLGGDVDKAADQTDKAMRMMADNVNTFGSDAESVQNAIMGLSRENYTMIDNLKLGFAGTKDGMKELMKDAEKYAKKVKGMGFEAYAESMKKTGLSTEELRKRYEELSNSTKLTMGNFSDMVDAIDIVQEKQNIWGTTSKEAMTTIEGSMNAAKASWQNLLTAIGSGNTDLIQESVSGLVVSLFGTWDDEVGKKTGGLINNLIPVVQNVASALSEQLPQVAVRLGYQFMQAFMQALGFNGSEIDTFIEDFDVQFSAARDKIVEIAGSIRQAVEDMIAGFTGTADIDGAMSSLQGYGDVLSQVWDFIQQNVLSNAGGFGETLGDVFNTVQELAGGIGDFLSSLGETIDWGYINVALESLKGIAEDVWGFIEQNILPNLPALGEAIGTVVNFVADVATTLLTVIDNLGPIIPMIAGAAGALMAFNAISGVIAAVTGAFTFFTTVIVPAIGAIQSLGGVVALVTTLLGGPIPIIVAIVGALVTLIATNEDVRNKLIEIWEAIKTAVGDALNGIKQWWDENVEYSKEWVENVKTAITTKWEEIVAWFSGLPDMITGAIGDLSSLLYNTGADIINGLLDGLRSVWDNVSGFFKDLTNMIPDWKGPRQRDLKLLTPSGEWIMQSLESGLVKGLPSVEKTLGDITDSIQTGISTNVSLASAMADGGSADVLGMLASIRDNMNMKVVLDSGRLVGGIAPQMNLAMGRL